MELESPHASQTRVKEEIPLSHSSSEQYQVASLGPNTISFFLGKATIQQLEMITNRNAGKNCHLCHHLHTTGWNHFPHSTKIDCIQLSACNGAWNCIFVWSSGIPSNT